jgi:protein-tyrosine-phosphatase
VPDHLSAPPEVFTILMVCTGNVCRSPFAERLARAYLDEALGDEEGLRIRVVSAGTQAVTGSTMHPHSALVLQGLGGDSGRFWAQQLDSPLASSADLTLTMTRGHRDEVLQLAPRSLARTFTLLEAAGLLASVGDTVVEGADLRERMQNLVRALTSARTRRRGSDADDIRDPVGRPLRVHQEVGEQIAGALLPILERIAALANGLVAELPRSVGPPPHQRSRRSHRR